MIISPILFIVIFGLFPVNKVKFISLRRTGFSFKKSLFNTLPINPLEVQLIFDKISLIASIPGLGQTTVTIAVSQLVGFKISQI